MKILPRSSVCNEDLLVHVNPHNTLENVHTKVYYILTQRLTIGSKSSLDYTGKGLIHFFVPIDMSYMRNESCCIGAKNQTALITVLITQEIDYYNLLTTTTAIYCSELGICKKARPV